MTTIDVLTDLHIGRHRFSQDYLDDFEEFFGTFIEKAGKDILVVNGDLFDNKRFIDGETFSSVKGFIEIVSRRYREVFFNVGNHDGVKRDSLNNTMFSLFEIPQNCHICVKPKTFYNDDLSFQIIPHKYDFSESADSDVDFIFSHHDRAGVVKGTTVLNGHIHTHHTNGSTFTNLGLCYQLDVSDSEKTLGWHQIKDSKIKRIEYTKRFSADIKMVDNKIDGTQPVKWLMAHKAEIADLRHVTLFVDHASSRANVNRLTGILSTVNPSFNLVDSVAESEDTTITVNSTVVETMNELLPDEEGFREKVVELYQRASK